MPPRSAEEKARRKLLHKEKLEARRKKKEIEEAAKKKKAEDDEAKKAKDHKDESGAIDDSIQKECYIIQLSDDPIHNILLFLSARDLGAFSMTCRQINQSMVEGKTHHLFSRLNTTSANNSIDDNDGERPGQLHVPIQICVNEIQVKELIVQALEGSGDTGRLITKRAKKNKGGCADEYMAYARFIEEATLGRTIQVSFYHGGYRYFHHYVT